MDMTAFLEGQDLLMHKRQGALHRSERRRLEKKTLLNPKSVNGRSKKRKRSRATSQSKKRARRDGSLPQQESSKSNGSLFISNSSKKKTRDSAKLISSTTSSSSKSKRKKTRKKGKKMRRRKSKRKKKVSAGSPTAKKTSTLKDEAGNAHSDRNKIQSNDNKSPQKPKKQIYSHLKTNACKGLHKLIKYKGYYRCRLCSKTCPLVFLCCNCDWAACSKCVELMKRNKSNRLIENKKQPASKNDSCIIYCDKQSTSKKLSLVEAMKAIDKLSEGREKKKANDKVKSNAETHTKRSKYCVGVSPKQKIRKMQTTSKGQKKESDLAYSMNSNTTTNSELVSDPATIVSSLTSVELCERLRRTGKDMLVKVAAIIQEEEMDGEDVVSLTQSELSQILPKWGMRKKLQRFLCELDPNLAQWGQGLEKKSESLEEPWIAPLTKRGNRSKEKRKSKASLFL